MKSNQTVLAIAVASLLSTGAMAQNILEETSYGDGNVTITDQLGTTLSSTIKQGVSGAPNDTNTAKVLQDGTSNLSTIDQVGDSNKVGGELTASASPLLSVSYSSGVIESYL